MRRSPWFEPLLQINNVRSDCVKGHEDAQARDALAASRHHFGVCDEDGCRGCEVEYPETGSHGSAFTDVEDDSEDEEDSLAAIATPAEAKEVPLQDSRQCQRHQAPSPYAQSWRPTYASWKQQRWRGSARVPVRVQRPKRPQSRCGALALLPRTHRQCTEEPYADLSPCADGDASSPGLALEECTLDCDLEPAAATAVRKASFTEGPETTAARARLAELEARLSQLASVEREHAVAEHSVRRLRVQVREERLRSRNFERELALRLAGLDEHVARVRAQVHESRRHQEKSSGDVTGAAACAATARQPASVMAGAVRALRPTTPPTSVPTRVTASGCCGGGVIDDSAARPMSARQPVATRRPRGDIADPLSARVGVPLCMPDVTAETGSDEGSLGECSPRDEEKEASPEVENRATTPLQTRPRFQGLINRAEAQRSVEIDLWRVRVAEVEKELQRRLQRAQPQRSGGVSHEVGRPGGSSCASELAKDLAHRALAAGEGVLEARAEAERLWLEVERARMASADEEAALLRVTDDVDACRKTNYRLLASMEYIQQRRRPVDGQGRAQKHSMLLDMADLTEPTTRRCSLEVMGKVDELRATARKDFPAMDSQHRLVGELQRQARERWQEIWDMRAKLATLRVSARASEDGRRLADVDARLRRLREVQRTLAGVAAAEMQTSDRWAEGLADLARQLFSALRCGGPPALSVEGADASTADLCEEANDTMNQATARDVAGFLCRMCYRSCCDEAVTAEALQIPADNARKRRSSAPVGAGSQVDDNAAAWIAWATIRGSRRSSAPADMPTDGLLGGSPISLEAQAEAMWWKDLRAGLHQFFALLRPGRGGASGDGERSACSSDTDDSDQGTSDLLDGAHALWSLCGALWALSRYASAELADLEDERVVPRTRRP
eukprot:TRINITY_DN12723_c0_g2_i1.p1 TRINITY_DN12723_c0_g2~~TRINITY_DN12723_c0_g2_i1.p1  ORF type:complete len:905 (-),score=167.24 TRINITY_DN12723_c0_g2_i1:7-2721(-)